MKENHKILFFDYSVNGHHLEYLNHLYNKAVQITEKEFIFVLPLEFTEAKEKMKWPKSKNITIYLENFEYVNKTSGLLKSYKLNRILHQQINKYKVTHVFLISLMSFSPMLPFLINKRIKVSGIIYQIYLYRWKESGLVQKIHDALKYILFSQLNVFDKIFILNDSASAKYLNRKFKTEKFEYLPDPFVPIPTDNTKNIRPELNIQSDKKVFLHFGGLSKRKGTLEILKAIENLNNDVLKNLCFIFAGKIYDDIKGDFYKKVDIQKHRAQILIYDEFCDFSFLGSLCLSSDYILIPYKSTSQSSGVLGYAAQFHKPVIAPNKKLLGKLVKKYFLGHTIKSSMHIEIKEFIKKTPSFSKTKNINKYLSDNNITNFTDVIFNNLVSPFRNNVI